MNSPFDEYVGDAQMQWEVRLIQKHYEKTMCRLDCPMYSELRDACQVLADDLDLDECPDYETVVLEDMRREREESEAGY